MMLRFFLLCASIHASKGIRRYILDIETSPGELCDSDADIGVNFINGCVDTPGSALGCDTTRAVTSTGTFTPGGLGEWATLTFNDIDIGNITHLKLSMSSANAWCFRDFNILIDNSSDLFPIWANCTVRALGYIAIDYDCTHCSGYATAIAAKSSVTIDVSRSSNLCIYSDDYDDEYGNQYSSMYATSSSSSISSTAVDATVANTNAMASMPSFETSISSSQSTSGGAISGQHGTHYPDNDIFTILIVIIAFMFVLLMGTLIAVIKLYKSKYTKVNNVKSELDTFMDDGVFQLQQEKEGCTKKGNAPK